tara:strand:- start:197 stop:574 length:378 start_codon:yes stop_codon:yes gene_type:complete
MAGILKRMKKAKVGRKITNTTNKAVSEGKKRNVVRKIQNTSAKVGTVAGKIDKVLDNPIVRGVALSNPYTAVGYVGAKTALGSTQQLAGGVNKGAKFARSDQGKRTIQKAKPIVSGVKKTIVKFV